MKNRDAYLQRISEDFEVVPICALLGPRQCGKTTLARQYAANYKGPVHYFDLEDYTDLARLNNPKLVLDAQTTVLALKDCQHKCFFCN